MKVLQVIPSMSGRDGGPSHAIVEIERALTARCIEVTTVTTNDDADGATLPVVCGQPIATRTATRWYFPRTTVFFKTSVAMVGWLRKNIRTFDVVHAHGLFSFAPVAAAYLARRVAVPYVLRPLGALAPYGMANRRPVLKKISLALIEGPLIEAASAIHFTSLAEREDAAALGLKCRGVVIPLGVGIGRWLQPHTRQRPIHPDAIRLLSMSRIDPKKNLEGLLRAVSLIRSKTPNVTLCVAGHGDPKYVAALQSLARALGIAAQVEWLGHLEGDDKAVALAAATAFILPSYSENFGLAVVEALAAGLPSIVSREVAICREIAASGAGLVVGTDADSIAAGIEALFAREDQYAAMSAAARAVASRAFSIEAMGERLEDLYRNVRGNPQTALAW